PVDVTLSHDPDGRASARPSSFSGRPRAACVPHAGYHYGPDVSFVNGILDLSSEASSVVLRYLICSRERLVRYTSLGRLGSCCESHFDRIEKTDTEIGLDRICVAVAS